MPIVASCSCGARFAARDDLAGKTVPCPKCKEPLTIPAAEEPAAETPPPKPAAPAKQAAPTKQAPAQQPAASPASAGQVIPVACSCGQKFGARPDLAGKTMKCPSCGAALTIPAPGGAAAKKSAPAPATKPTAPAAPAGGMTDLLDDLGVHKSKTGVRCAKCQTDIKPGTVICIKCGYNQETGHTMQTKRWS